MDTSPLVLKIFWPIVGIINRFIAIFIGLAVLFFLIGVLKYAFSKDEKTRNESRSIIIYGIIGLTAMTGVWGLVNILSQSTDLPDTAPQQRQVNPTNLIKR